MNSDSPCRCHERPTLKAVAPTLTDTELFERILFWQAKGYHPELHTAMNDQWVLILSTDHWTSDSINQRSRQMGLKYVTEPCPTPQDAIRAAMEHIQ
jgi:hypothetical protein